MKDGVTHVIGAGLAGLSAAVRLAEAGARVAVHEGAPEAGGRCRSYFDAQLGLTIDNGNHLVLSGNHSVRDYLHLVGAGDALAGPPDARIEFMDLGSGARWTVRPNDGPFPWWVLDRNRRTPGSSAADHLTFAKLMSAPPGASIGDVIKARGPIWTHLLAPFLLAALNTAPEDGSAALAGAVIRETLAKGGEFSRPRIAHPNLGAALIAPALAYLAGRKVPVTLGARVASLNIADGRVVGFSKRDAEIKLGPNDQIILATPPWAAQELAPGISAPTEFRAIVNAHFKIETPVAAPWMLGIIGGVAEWIFVFPDRISVTVSAADRLLDMDRAELAQTLWLDVARAHSLGAGLPPWQIVKERRATFAATPGQVRLRPAARTEISNLFLAGDWTDTGLPATIEGAVRSGAVAAALALGRPVR